MLRHGLGHLRRARNLHSLAFLLAVGVILPTHGCKQKDEPPEVLSVEGKIDKVKVRGDGGEITVVYYSDMQKKETVGTANVTPTTEILINGAVATLADLQQGEHVRGDVRVEKRGDSRVLTALKIYVDRPTGQEEPPPQ